MTTKGKLISIEGMDGSGKTTLCLRLQNLISVIHQIQSTVCSAVSEWSPNVGYAIGEIVKNPKMSMHADTEMLLMTAARVQVWHETIKPALERGDIVISDRHNTSMFAYQKDEGGLWRAPFMVKSHLMRWGIDREADINILLDVDPESPLKAQDGKRNRLEDRPMSEWQAIRDILRIETERKPNNLIINVNVNDADRVLDIAFDFIVQKLGLSKRMAS